MKKMINHNHMFHLVTPSPWPIIISLSLFNNLISIITWLHKMNYMVMISFPCTIMCLFQWWRDIIRESTFQGSHTYSVYLGLRLGMILFIISEIFFFLSFFWAYFHSSLAPSVEIGQLWPPLGIKPFNPFDIPLLNTIILITSGMTITWAHHSILIKNFMESMKSLSLTIFLGVYFSILQLFEYKESPFTMSDSIYGSSFFIATGFHGIHVIIGTIFLIISLFRLFYLHYSNTHHFGFEAAAWYWHFVDIVWLLLYISIYWWSH